MTAQGYRELLTRYLTHESDLGQLEKQFDDYFYDEAELDHPLFLIINDVFMDLDACWDSTLAPEKETASSITEMTLRLRLGEAIARLDEYGAGGLP